MKVRQNGFTLIELLVVISVIGFLASMAIFALNVARVKARDVKRKADLVQIQKGLEIYYDKFGAYPTEDYCDSSRGTCATACPCAESDWTYSGGFIANVFRTNSIISVMPKDPLNNSVYYYSYEPDCSQGSCAPSGGCCYYSLSARLEGGGSFSLTGGKY